MRKIDALHACLAKVLMVLLVSAWCGSPLHAGDVIRVRLDADARETPATGRVIVFFTTESLRSWKRAEPSRGPFWRPPQPIASVAVTDLAAGATVEIDGSAVAFPASIDTFSGTFRVQAALDAAEIGGNLRQEAGNVLSRTVEVELREGRDDTVELVLDRRVREPRLPADTPTLRWVELRSEMLSEFYGRDVYHRAGVALPPGYGGDAPARETWGAVYVIPGFGGRHFNATTYGDMFATRGIEEFAPLAVHVVLDPDSQYGHHGFVDSPNVGPRGTALVREFIPWLEREFGLEARPEARLVTGHSSGGWSSLWLQLRWPGVFGGCWSSAPDPVDFSAFQMSDLYRDASLFYDEQRRLQPSLRRIVSVEGDTEPVMFVRDECRMEHAMSPAGLSGQQWDAWQAMFSSRDPETGHPVRLYDPESGAINRVEVEANWSKFDIVRRVSADWETYGPILAQRVRLSCGDLDSFYLQRAVERLKAVVEARPIEGPGYVRIVPDATHGNLTSMIFQDVNEEMRAHLRAHGLQD